MIRTLLLSTVALAALAGQAVAADLPSRRAPPVYMPPPPIPVFTWTGFYVGGHVGYEFGTSKGLITNNVTGVAAAVGSANANGIVGGAHVGYLYSTQGIPFFGGALGSGGVIGLEGDVDGTSARANYLIGAVANSSRENIQGSVRGRLGVAVDRALFYVTGGAAFGSLTNSYASPFGVDSYDHTKVGWTAGAGVEYAVTNNWSVRVEYRYTDFGRVNDVLVASTPGGIGTASHRITDNRVQAGFSYRFDTFTPAPVVARY